MRSLRRLPLHSAPPYREERCGAVGSVVPWSTALVVTARIFHLQTTEPFDAGFPSETGYSDHPPQYLAFLLFIARAVLDELLLENTQFIRHIHMARTVPYL